MAQTGRAVIINYYRIPDDDVISIETLQKQITFTNNKLMASSCTVKLNNIDKSKYDDRYAGSLFYGTNFYNKKIVIIDNDIAKMIFYGRIKRIEVTDTEVTVEATNYFKDLLDTVCVYSAQNKTFAEHIKNIIIGAGISEEIIKYGDYVQTKQYQEAHLMTCNITYTKDDNVECMRVIEELCRISQIDLYDANNLIVMKQWAQYDGTMGYKIYDDVYIPGTYKHWYDDSQLYNEVNIAYLSGSLVSFYSSEVLTSKQRYNISKIFQVPNDNQDSSTPADYKILINTIDSATAIASHVILRYNNIKKYCSFVLDGTTSYIDLYDTVDLNIDGLQNEPVKIIAINDKNENKIEYKAEFINQPVEIIELDKTPPNACEIVLAQPVSSTSVVLKWTQNKETDLSGYLLYFTSSGKWTGAACGEGLSPIEIKNPAIIDGYCYHVLSGLKNNTTYKFKMRVFDTRYNYSDYSNIVECTIIDELYYSFENKYRTQGNIFTGINLDVSNSGNGRVPALMNYNWYLYDTVYYDAVNYSPAAIYESFLIYKNDGISEITIKGSGGQGIIKYQKRYYNNGSFSPWSDEYDAIGIININCENNKFVQLRFIFYSVYWDDTYNIYVIKIL